MSRHQKARQVMKPIRIRVVWVCAAMAAIAGCRYAPIESVPSAERPHHTAPEKNDSAQGRLRLSEAQLDIEMLSLKTAYDNERKRLDLACANELTHWGFIMKGNKEEALREKYWRIASARLQETASSDEWRLISEYAPELDEVLTTRGRLREKIEIWNRVRNAHGVFAGQGIRFENGVAEFKDRSCDWAEALGDSEYKDGFPMKVRIDRNLVWTSHGTDYVLAHSDCAAIIDDEIKGVGAYGETDSSRSTWFLRFKDGVLIDTCDLGNEYWDEDRQLFCFEPRNNRLEILSVSKGKLVKELFLALWDYGKFPDGSHCFGTNKEPITDSAHDCAKLSGVHFE